MPLDTLHVFCTFVSCKKKVKDMAEDFLSNFQKTAFTTQHGARRTTGKVPVFFMIDADAARGESTVAVVNEKGEPAEPDYRLYQGETFNVLRMMANIRQEQGMRISWGVSDDCIRLAEYPYLLFALLRCDNLVDKQLNPVKVEKDEAVIVLAITSNGTDDNCMPRLAASVSGMAPQPFSLLSDVFALVGQKIYPIASLGENYQRLRFFLEPFPKALLEQYLSVFYSYVDNVELAYDDYRLIHSDQTVQAVPTVVIEKVDADMALYLRLSYTLPGMTADFGERFDLTYVAQLQDMERQVVLRRIIQCDMAKEEESLHKMILGYASNRQAAKEVWSQGGEFIIPQETAGPFLLQALPLLAARYQLFGAEKLREYRVKAVRPKMKLGLSSGIDFLEGTAIVNLDGEEMSLRKFLQQYNKQKYITLSDGNRALIDEHYVRRLERIFKRAEKGASDKVRVSFFDLPEIESLLQERLEGEVFEHHRKFYEGFNLLGGKRLQTNEVKATLRNYQKEGVKWINYLYENNMGGCLADDMGLGKTLQTITMLAKVYTSLSNQGKATGSSGGKRSTGARVLRGGLAKNETGGEASPSLIVMPRSLLFNWQDELQKFAPQLTYYIYYGGQRNLDEAMDSQLILTTYALVRNDIDELRKRQFHYIVLDESQNIKNLSSQVTQAVFLLNGRHRLALSGTPIENNLSELYSLFRFLNPAMFGSADDFNRQYAYPIQRDSDKEATESLRRKIFPFMLRRLKKDVLKELPDRMEQTLYVEMGDDHRQLYEQRRKYYQQLVGQSIDEQGLEHSQMVMFQALSELRRISSVPESLSEGTIASPKIPLLCDSIEEAVAGGHKVVVFFNFIAGIELVGERLTELGIDYATMTGSTHDRRAVIERFQQDAGCRALLMTLKTGGVGLNLTVADTVYIFEPWWNKAAEEQAINRLHRIGQKAKVMSYALITRDTIEEKIRLLQQQKKDLADSLITGDQSMTKHLTEDDIKYILG